VKSTEKPARCTEKPAGIPKFRNFEFENSFRSKLPENREISAGIPFPVVTEIFFKNENVNPGRGRSARACAGHVEADGRGAVYGLQLLAPLAVVVRAAWCSGAPAPCGCLFGMTYWSWRLIFVKSKSGYTNKI